MWRALHRLRKLANAILHLDREKDEGLPSPDEVKLEKEIISLLFVLRALIEGVKMSLGAFLRCDLSPAERAVPFLGM